MNITMREAADALGTTVQTIIRWTKGYKYAVLPEHPLDLDAFCDMTGLDVRFMLAFLTGYDIALSRNQVADLTGKNYLFVRDHEQHAEFKPVLRYPAVGAYPQTKRTVRLSYRRVLPFIVQNMEKTDGKRAARNLSKTARMPSPDTLSRDFWKFKSVLELKGSGVPVGNRSRLERGFINTLPVLSRS